jgi:hypothetical protein
MKKNGEKGEDNQWKDLITYFSSIFSISFHYFLRYFPNLFTIQPTFLRYFPYHFIIFFHIFHIFNLLENSSKIWKIWKKIMKWYGKYRRKVSRISEKIWKIWKKGKLNSKKIWKKGRKDEKDMKNTYFSSIFSISFHYFLPYFPYL